MSRTDDIEWEVMPSEIKPKDKRLEKIRGKNLPSLPATFYLMGSCGSGKSSILYSLIVNGYVYGKKKKSVFDEMLVYLGTLDSKPAFEKLPIENKLILDEYDPVSFEEYQNDLKMHQIEKLNDGKAPLNTLLVFDDFVGAGLMKKPRPNAPPPIEKLCLTSRHECNATIFFLSQVYKGSGFSVPSVRNNITCFIVSRMNRSELVKIADELSDDYEPDEWLEHYDRIMAKSPYNFVSRDIRRPIAEGRWREKFHIQFPKSRKQIEMEKLMNSKRVRAEAESSSDEE
jgi:hypothetical protein